MYSKTDKQQKRKQINSSFTPLSKTGCILTRKSGLVNSVYNSLTPFSSPPFLMDLKQLKTT